MNFVDSVKSGLKNFVNFRGKASRSEFWYWVLFRILLSLVLGTVENAIWPATMATSGDLATDLAAALSAPTPLTSIATLLFFLPDLSVLARRFHDAGFSAKWLLLQLAPVIYGVFASIGVVVLLNDAVPGQELSSATLMPIIFLVIPIFALFAVVIVAYLIMTTKKSRSFYDGNKYVEPTPLQPGDEGTTA
jgi:uncharacterized membrane protein YhaH (DUF805 family)